MKHTLIILLAMFLCLGMAGCKEKEPHYETYENHDIFACGIKDPLQNLEWFKEFVIAKDEESKHSYYNYKIYLYRNIETEEEYIVLTINPFPFGTGDGKEYTGMFPSDFIYSCTGEQLFVDASGESIFSEWHNFFYSGKNESQGIIWQKINVY